MHTIDMDNDPQWIEKLKENRVEAQRDSRVQAVQAWAVENYDNGADTIVEAFEPDEILELIQEADTPEAAIRVAHDYCGLRRSVENDVRGYGDLPPLPNITDTHPTPNDQEDTMSDSTATPQPESIPTPEVTETPEVKVSSSSLVDYLKDRVSSDLDAPHQGLPYITEDNVLRVRPTDWMDWLGSKDLTVPKRQALGVLKDAGLVQKSTTLPAVEGHPKGKAQGLYTGPAPRGTASLPRYSPPARTAKAKVTTTETTTEDTTGQDISQVEAVGLQVGDIIGTTRTNSRKTIAEGSGKTVASITVSNDGRVQARDDQGKMIRSCEPTTKVWRGRTVA